MAQDEPTATGASAAPGAAPQSAVPPVAGPPVWGAPPGSGWRYEPVGPANYGLPGPEPTLLWGGVGVRLGALALDALIIAVALFAIGLVAGAVEPVRERSDTTQAPVTMALTLIWIVFALLYHPVCWYVLGGSPGQKALGLRIARASDGADMDIGRVLVRYLVFMFVTVVVPVGIISGVMTAQDPFKRAWHDQVARTLVVKRR